MHFNNKWSFSKRSDIITNFDNIIFEEENEQEYKLKEDVKTKDNHGDLSELWNDKELVINTIIMVCIWAITSFNYYLMSY